jgi:hypothetical protein
MLVGSSRYGYKYLQYRVKPLGHATSAAEGIAVLYVGVEPFAARAGGVDVRADTAVMVAVREKLVYERPQPNGKRGTMLFLLR